MSFISLKLFSAAEAHQDFSFSHFPASTKAWIFSLQALASSAIFSFLVRMFRIRRWSRDASVRLAILWVPREESERETRRPSGVIPFSLQRNRKVRWFRCEAAILELGKKGVVHEVPCGECNHVYIGETGRTLRKRLTEHKAAVKKCDTKNGIAVHIWNSEHQVEWESAKVKEVVPNLTHGRIAKALHIFQTPNTTNLDCGLTLDSIWFPLLS